jgi:hypothetical protein
LILDLNNDHKEQVDDFLCRAEEFSNKYERKTKRFRDQRENVQKSLEGFILSAIIRQSPAQKAVAKWGLLVLFHVLNELDRSKNHSQDLNESVREHIQNCSDDVLTKS